MVATPAKKQLLIFSLLLASVEGPFRRSSNKRRGYFFSQPLFNARWSGDFKLWGEQRCLGAYKSPSRHWQNSRFGLIVVQKFCVKVSGKQIIGGQIFPVLCKFSGRVFSPSRIFGEGAIARITMRRHLRSRRPPRCLIANYKRSAQY